MACNKIPRRTFALRRKLHILRTLTKSNSVKNSSIVMDACLYIHKLKLQIEAIRTECQYLFNHIQEVKVEQIGEEYLSVRLTCKKGQEWLASILEVLEEMDLNVVQASFTSQQCLFGMEAIVRTSVDAVLVNEAILKAIHRPTE